MTQLTMLNHMRSCFCLIHLRCHDIAAKQLLLGGQAPGSPVWAVIEG